MSTFDEVEFFARVVLDMTGHIIGYLSEHELQEINLLLGVRRWASGTLEPSFTKPRRGWALVFLPQVTPSARNSAKLLSSDSTYVKFGFQFSKVLTVSDFERLHCFGNSCFVSVLRVDCAWATKMLEESTYQRLERRLCLVFDL